MIFQDLTFKSKQCFSHCSNTAFKHTKLQMKLLTEASCLHGKKKKNTTPNSCFSVISKTQVSTQRASSPYCTAI